MKLTCNTSEADPLFVYYYLCSPEGQTKLSHTTTTGVPALARPSSALKDVTIPLPSLKEQNKIANFLDVLGQQIFLVKKQSLILEQIAQTVFKSWFVDFDGVTEFEDSELGKIPKGWKVEKLEDLCSSIQNGGTPKRKELTYWENGTIDWYKTGELSDNFLIESEEKITELGLKKSSSHQWPKNTILIAIYAFPVVGRLGILTKPSCSNQACSGLIPKKFIGTNFLFFSLMFSRDKLSRIATGAAQQNINQDIVKNHKIIISPIFLISKFNETTNPILDQIKINEIKILTLTKIRDSLLPKLMSGEIGV